jgi:hypothetical protein
MMCSNSTIYCATQTLVKKDEITTMYPILGVFLIGFLSFSIYYCYKNYYIKKKSVFIEEKSVVIEEKHISVLNKNKQKFELKNNINSNMYDKDICEKFNLTLQQHNEIKNFLKDLRLEFDNFAIKEKDFKLTLSEVKDSAKAAKLQSDFNITKLKFNEKLNFLNNIAELKFGTNMHELTEIMNKIYIEKTKVNSLIKKINFNYSRQLYNYTLQTTSDFYKNLGLSYTPYSLQMTLDAVLRSQFIEILFYIGL